MRFHLVEIPVVIQTVGWRFCLSAMTAAAEQTRAANRAANAYLVPVAHASTAAGHFMTNIRAATASHIMVIIINLCESAPVAGADLVPA